MCNVGLFIIAFAISRAPAGVLVANATLIARRNRSYTEHIYYSQSGNPSPNRDLQPIVTIRAGRTQKNCPAHAGQLHQNKKLI
jgi:hypothetical protein